MTPTTPTFSWHHSLRALSLPSASPALRRSYYHPAQRRSQLKTNPDALSTKFQRIYTITKKIHGKDEIDISNFLFYRGARAPGKYRDADRWILWFLPVQCFVLVSSSENTKLQATYSCQRNCGRAPNDKSIAEQTRGRLTEWPFFRLRFRFFGFGRAGRLTVHFL